MHLYEEGCSFCFLWSLLSCDLSEMSMTERNNPWRITEPLQQFYSPMSDSQVIFVKIKHYKLHFIVKLCSSSAGSPTPL